MGSLGQWAGLLLLLLSRSAQPQGLPVASLTVGVRVTLEDAAQPRKTWRDFGEHARSLSGLAMAKDPVFHTPSAQSKALYGQVIKRVEAPPSAAVVQSLKDLFSQEPDGPALARIAATDKDSRVVATALQAMTPDVVALHPRVLALAVTRGMVQPDQAAPDPALAVALIHADFACHCDAMALYGLDGLQHPEARVQAAAVSEALNALRHQADIGIGQKLLDWLSESTGNSMVRLQAVRGLGEVGWLPATVVLERLARGPNKPEAAEALVALAAVAPTLAEPLARPWLRDPAPVRRAAAVRALAQCLAMQPEAAWELLAPLASDGGRGVDPLEPDGGQTVGGVVKLAKYYIEI